MNPAGNKKHIQDLCTKKGLPLTVTDAKVKEGWMNKPKGAIQILFERGWLDPDHIHLYSSEGKKNANPNLTHPADPTGCNYSIQAMMNKQRDFVNELTLLQYHGQKLGVVIDCTPKCHPEIAGEGIEYLWGLAKFWYRRAPIAKKQSKDSFRKLVCSATDGNTVLNLHRV